MPDDEVPEQRPPDIRKKAEWAIAVWMVLFLFVPAVLYYAGRIASLVVILLPPFAFGTLAVFVYVLWGKKYLRARHIAGIRERRLLDEAARRDHTN